MSLSHGLSMCHQLRVQLIQVQQRLLLHMSQQPQRLRRHLDIHKQVTFVANQQAEAVWEGDILDLIYDSYDTT